MSSALDMALDDVISSNRTRRGGVRKQTVRGGGARNQTQQQRRPNTRSNQAPRSNAPRNTLMVANLHNRVNEKDLYELFGQIGKVNRAYIHLAPNGTSSGVANVVFKVASDAERALNTYNNVALDGRAMKISYAPLPDQVSFAMNPINNRISSRNPTRPSFGNDRQGGGRPTGSGRPAGRTNNARGRGSGRQPRRTNRPAPSQADLDADMDTYMANEDTTMN